MSHISVTGGAGFIGANLVLAWLSDRLADDVLNVDMQLTSAGNDKVLASLDSDERYILSQANICDRTALDERCAARQPPAVTHFPVEGHVALPILGPGKLIQPEIVGTFTLPEAARAYWGSLDELEKCEPALRHLPTTSAGSGGRRALLMDLWSRRTQRLSRIERRAAGMRGTSVCPYEMAPP